MRSGNYQKSNIDAAAGASDILRLAQVFAEYQPNPASCLHKLRGSANSLYLTWVVLVVVSCS